MVVQTDTRGRESDGSTRVKVSDPVADELYKRKRRKDTYEDVIRRLLRRTESSEGER